MLVQSVKQGAAENAECRTRVRNAESTRCEKLKTLCHRVGGGKFHWFDLV